MDYKALLEFLRDAVWNFVAVIIALVALFFAQRQQRKKEISCTANQAPLFKVSDGFKDDLQVLYDGKPLLNANLVIVVLSNTGNEPIMPADYFRNIALEFGKDSNIVTAEILPNDESRNIEATIKIDKNRIEFEPILINSGEQIDVRVIVTQIGKITLNGRIAGGKLVLRSSRDILIPPMFADPVLIIGGALFGAFIQGFISQLPTGNAAMITAYVVLGFVGLLSTFFVLASRKPNL